MDTKRIAVSEKSKSSLVSREAASLLFSHLNNFKSDLEVDFSDVEFTSRSYADQFYKERIAFEKKYNVTVHIVNANEEVINMLQVVAKTQASSERNFEKTPIFRFSKPQLLSDYLLSI